MRPDPREKASKAGYAKALRLAARERKTLARVRERALAAETRAWLKAEEPWHKLRKAEGQLVELPALVTRDGTVTHISLADAIDVTGFYLTALCLDCETSGYWIGHDSYELRTIQLGGEDAAVVFDALDPGQRAVVAWILARATALHAHSAPADVCPLVHAGLISWDDAWAKMTDSVLIAKLTDPKMSGSDADGLKELEHDLLREYAVALPAEKAKNELFKAMGCLMKTDVTTPPERNGWHQVNRFSEVMIRYAGSDVLALGAVLRALPPLPVSTDVLARERVTQGMCARAAMQGFPLDLPHIQAKIMEAEREKAGAQRWAQEMSGGRITNPSSSTEVLAALTELGYELKPDRKTGQPSAGKGSLEPFAARGDELAKSILDYRANVTKLGLLLRPLEALCTHGDAIMRPTVYTINAVTGRMSCVRPNGQQFCYTSDMDILTSQGWKAFSEIDGSEHVAQWSDGVIEFVVPEAVVHEPYEGSMIRIHGEHHDQVVTPGHRVYSKTRDGKLMIERADSWLKHGAVGKIVDRKLIRGGRLAGRKLTDSERLSLYRAVAVQADGHLRDDCRFISLKLTRARKVQRSRELGFEVRETPNSAGGKKIFEAKAYAADCEPWLSLPAKTFNIPALLELDASELELFLHEVMIWDGDSTRLAAYNQAVERTESVDAVEMAAFLSGNSTCRSVKRVAGRDYANVQVYPKAERHASRTRVEEVPSDGMVHCVTVPSGAVVVRCNGKVIVSGNSRQGGVRACVTCWLGYLGISADFAGCEICVAAALSGDRALYEAETGPRCHRCGTDADVAKNCACGPGKAHQGLHWLTAHTAYGDKATKEDRYNAKRGTFTRLFGGGPQTAADQVGTELSVMQELFAAFDTVAPAFTAWDSWMRQCFDAGSLVWRDYETGVNYSQDIPGSRRMVYRTYSGRNVYVTRGAHAAGNGAIQGTARELLVDGLLEWQSTPWGHLPVLPVHDQLIVMVPEDQASIATKALAACMTSERLSSPGFPVHIGVDTDEPFTSWPDSS